MRNDSTALKCKMRYRLSSANTCYSLGGLRSSLNRRRRLGEYLHLSIFPKHRDDLQ